MVIGAGFGGMAAAIRLRARGYRVTLLEALEQTGGRASVFHRDGFTFDAGPTVITAPYLVDELFELVGREPADHYEMVPVDPFYRVEFADGSRFDYVDDEERLLAQIRAFSPGDVEGYLRLADHARRIFEIGYVELADAPFLRVTDMLRVAPAMMRLENHKSVYALVSQYIEDERLRQVFSFQPLLIGGNPFRCSSIYMLIHWLERRWGVHWAKGGTTALVGALTRLMSDIGVDVRLQTPVERITVSGGRVEAVETASGEHIPADLIVCNGDPSTVYTRLLAPEHRRHNTDRAIRRKRQGMSLFVAWFGANRTWPELAHHTIILGPRYRELLEDIFERKILADDFSLYLHAPTRSDPSMAPPGHEAFYVLSPVPNQRSGIDWEARHQEYLDRLLDALDATHLPGLRESLVTSFAVDPRYFEGRLRSYDGAAFGLEPRLTQSAWFRYHNASEDVGGLYFVGASTHPGAGMPGVLSTAKVLERIVPEVEPWRREPIPGLAS
ncbi:MAG: phytoene desaturase [Deltaproteobacteria bacterium]|nr:phytoene desaturase [Deltaproteobacteria bacterium]MCB9787479.1 phytoene desaturase [Deltaproteobacteria bacterium]